MAVSPRRCDGQSEDDDLQFSPYLSASGPALSSLQESVDGAGMTFSTRLIQYLLNFHSALRIGVLAKSPHQHRCPDSCVPFCGLLAQISDNFLRILRYQNFMSRLKEHLYAMPLVGDKTCAAPAASKIRVGGEKPTSAIESRLISVPSGRKHSRDYANRCQRGPSSEHSQAKFSAPSFAAQEEIHLRSQFSSAQKEMFYSSLTIGQTIAYKHEITS